MKYNGVYNIEFCIVVTLLMDWDSPIYIYKLQVIALEWLKSSFKMGNINVMGGPGFIPPQL